MGLFLQFFFSRKFRTIRAKICEKLPKFVKVTTKILSVPFFRTRCILDVDRSEYLKCSRCALFSWYFLDIGICNYECRMQITCLGSNNGRYSAFLWKNFKRAACANRHYKVFRWRLKVERERPFIHFSFILNQTTGSIRKKHTNHTLLNANRTKLHYRKQKEERTRGQSNLTKSAVRGHLRGSKVV